MTTRAGVASDVEAAAPASTASACAGTSSGVATDVDGGEPPPSDISPSRVADSGCVWTQVWGFDETRVQVGQVLQK